MLRSSQRALSLSLPLIPDPLTERRPALIRGDA
jgi:hypothetical protein